MKIIIVLSIMFFIVSSIFSIKSPSDPKTPVITDTSKKDDSQKAGNNQLNTSNKKTSYKVRVILANGKFVDGRISLKYSWFKIKHLVNGFMYHKKVFFNEIRSIRIIKWKPQLSKSSKNPMYYFVPEHYRITTKDKVSFVLKKRLKLLDRIVITNKYGTTNMFSYFVDYWIGNKTSGYWSNSKSKSFSYNTQNPNAGVVRMIKFIK
ncbi:MAG: hypothetical protein KAS64_11500 [Spirochaetes bacterium]|nr:hypothetical protein [Spirochaetota bacterium]